MKTGVGIGGKISSLFFGFSFLVLLVFYLYNRFLTYPMLADEELEKMDDIALLLEDDVRVAWSSRAWKGWKSVSGKAWRCPACSTSACSRRGRNG